MSDEIDLDELEAAIREERPAGLVDSLIRMEALLMSRRDARAIVERYRRSNIRPGPPSGTGVRVEDVERAMLALRGPDGSWPTAEAVAEELGKSSRWVSSVLQPAGGYKATIARLEARTS